MQFNPQKPVATELALCGTCGYDHQGARIRLEVAEIAHFRAADIVSGTLSLELWALEQAFQGGSFFGHSLAGSRVGELQGEHVFRDVSYLCDFTEPPAGTWYLCMMLREWNGVAYETRDFINFDIPYVVQDHSLQEPSNVIVIDFKEAVVSHANVATDTDSAPVVTPPQRKKSINDVTLKDLAQVKGLSHKTKVNLLAAQPFADWDDVLEVKGIGVKMQKLLSELYSLP